MKTLHEILSVQFPTSDIDAMIQSMEKAVEERKEVCANQLAQENAKIAAEKERQKAILKNKSKRKWLVAKYLLLL